jgi:hypothetical protein
VNASSERPAAQPHLTSGSQQDGETGRTTPGDALPAFAAFSSSAWILGGRGAVGSCSTTDRTKPKGRRDLSVSKLPKVVVEFTDPDLAIAPLVAPLPFG